jgi:hypothetical protein
MTGGGRLYIFASGFQPGVYCPGAGRVRAGLNPLIDFTRVCGDDTGGNYLNRIYEFQ